MKEFLGTTDSVLYVSFTQPLIKPLGAYVSAMLSNLVTQALSRQVAPGEDLTYFVLDEGVYLKDVEFLSDIPKKGRGSGLGACMSVISLPALVQAFGKDRADEVVSNTRLTLALACDGATARHLSDLTGVAEGGDATGLAGCASAGRASMVPNSSESIALGSRMVDGS